MTICIAAVCDGGKSIVVAADRMFTAPAPTSMEFETSEKKIEPLATGCVAMSAGNSAYATEIIAGTLVGLAGVLKTLLEIFNKAEGKKPVLISSRLN
jgi:hypothetical protein